jgi:hypothetical protein
MDFRWICNPTVYGVGYNPTPGDFEKYETAVIFLNSLLFFYDDDVMRILLNSKTLN